MWVKSTDMLKAREFAASIVINDSILFVAGGTNVHRKNRTVQSSILTSTEFVTNDNSIPGPELPIPISDACFIKINDSIAILVGRFFGNSLTLQYLLRYIC